jgi:hypothetical protein
MSRIMIVILIYDSHKPIILCKQDTHKNVCCFTAVVSVGITNINIYSL